MKWVLGLLLATATRGYCDQTYRVGSGGVSLYKLPRHKLTRQDQDKLFDTGGARQGLVRGCTIRVLERQEYEYGRTSYEGTAYTSAGAVDSHSRSRYFYRVGYIRVLDAPAQRHMEGKVGWIVLEKHSYKNRKWVTEYVPDLTPSTGVPTSPGRPK